MPVNQKTPFSDFLFKTSKIVRRKAYIDTPTFLSTSFGSTDAPFVLKPKQLQVGKMYLFVYDAKWKHVLPVWDMFPLIFPFAFAGDRFWGMNMHYLSIPFRAQLMDALYTVANDQTIQDDTRLVLNYKILSSLSKFKLVKATIHEYLNSHTRSKFLIIPATQWKTALLLQSARFVGPRAASVYADAAKKAGFRSRAQY
jgi:hypothetical protein